MIKTLLIGLWVCIVALGSTFFFITMQTQSVSSEAAQKESSAVEFIKTDMVSVPVIKEGKVQGYLVTQISFAVNTAETLKLSFEPTPYLIDVAYRTLYENSDVDFSRLKTQDLSVLTQKIAAAANTKFGSEVVKDVLLNEINYVLRDEVRTNWVKKKE